MDNKCFRPHYITQTINRANNCYYVNAAQVASLSPSVLATHSPGPPDSLTPHTRSVAEFAPGNQHIICDEFIVMKLNNPTLVLMDFSSDKDMILT